MEDRQIQQKTGIIYCNMEDRQIQQTTGIIYVACRYNKWLTTGIICLKKDLEYSIFV